VKRALISVSDKTGLESLVPIFQEHNVEILSTGGTSTKLRELGLKVKDVAEYTKSPEMLDGRVKTLHPMIHGGLLGVRGNEQHERDMALHGIQEIDIVIVNLYAFDATVAKGGDFDTCIENIDIGGPSMLRSSAKNHKAVVICTNPSQYPELIASMNENKGSTTMELRKKFAGIYDLKYLSPLLYSFVDFLS
jgi:phosphoribosylaminoimidazolecarboxamide formyltransferase/IMP cyclohydrolase